MSAGISLNSSVRNSLLSLQDTANLQATTQNHLSTGKKVASALDNPTNFFTASSLNDRSATLTGLLDGISNGVQTIQAASKGIDSITSLVKSLQSTVKQAQSDAVANRPKIAATGSFGTAAEAALTGKSQHDTALAKTLIGTAATATAASAGVVGLTAAATGSTNSVQIKAGNTTYKFDVTSTSTVRDLVDGINKSGIATAAVGDDGKLTVTGTGSDNLTIEAGTTTTATGVFAAVAGDQTALFGTADNTDVGGSGSSAVRSNLVKQFNDLRDQIDSLAKDSGFNGTNLLGGDKLSITFNEKTGGAQNKLDVQGNLLSSASLGIGKFVDSSTASSTGDFSVQNDADLTKAADALTTTLTSLRSQASTLGSNLSVVQTRQDFTKQLANVLTTGADNLTNADLNSEAANYTALQTRQSIAQQTLGLANQANQGVLQLLR
ncbi:flagellin [uncultured Methylobacterium sp.]|uniref:flagellin N-terminal helical domain-containing protein n=1 Tax=uncultured Methylobacterium sp. TaxID=157278 RepID=UPI0035CA347B